jgi:hypothetical protein
VAGNYSCNKNGEKADVMGVLDNMRKGMRAATEIFLAGFAPFCPWLDYHYQLMLRDNEELTIENYYEYSIAWLKKSDYMLVLPNSENSKGVQKEISVALEMRIPTFYTMREFLAYESEIKAEEFESKKELKKEKENV